MDVSNPRFFDPMPRSDQTAAPGAPSSPDPYLRIRFPDGSVVQCDGFGTVVKPPEPYRGGYPFMALAKQHSVDYGNVLVVADNLKQWERFGYRNPLPALKEMSAPSLRGLPDSVLHDIDVLVRQPVWARGQ